MNRKEADELIKLVESFVEGPQAPEEGEVVEEPKPQVEVTEGDLNKMFRTQVPEGFDIAKADLVRASYKGDQVFLRFGNERRWIPDLDTLERLGFELGDVQEITDTEMKAVKEGFGLLSCKLW